MIYTEVHTPLPNPLPSQQANLSLVQWILVQLIYEIFHKEKSGFVKSIHDNMNRRRDLETKNTSESTGSSKQAETNPT
jgi:hypothetical protein